MKHNIDMIFGIHPVSEALESGKEIEKILVDKNSYNENLFGIKKQAGKLNIPLQYVPLAKLDNITRKNHQGVICFLSAIQYASLDNILDSCYAQGRDPFILVLDQVTDIRNFGAICRTAECAGADAIVVPAKGAALINADAVRTSAGALNYISICRENSLQKSVKFLKDSGLKIIASTEKTEQVLFKQDLSGPIAVIMGSEETGVSNELLRIADQWVKIPMFGKISSLNVSASAAVVLYEIVKQRT